MKKGKFNSAAAAVAAIVAGTAGLAQDGGHSFRQAAQRCGDAESYQTAARQTIEVILPDGTSVVLSPGSQASVGCDASGAATISLESGLIRVAAGTGNERRVTITTAEAELSLRGGAAIIEVAGGATRSHLIYGGELVVSASGTERLLYRPGFEVVAEGGRPGQPRRMSADDLLADIQRLSEGLSDGTLPRILSLGGGSATGGPALTGFGTTPNESLDSEFDFAIPLVDRLALQTEDDGGPGDSPDNMVPPTSPPTTPPVTPPVTPPQPLPEPRFDLAGSLNGIGGFTAAPLGPAPEIAENSSTTVEGPASLIKQQFDDGLDPGEDGLGSKFQAAIFLGPTSNRAFANRSLSPAVSDANSLGRICSGDPCNGNTTGVGYYFGDFSDGIVASPSPTAGGPNTNSQDSGLIRLQGIGNGRVSTFSFHNSDFGILRSDTTFGNTVDGFFAISSPSPGFWLEGKGVVVEGLNYGTTYERGRLQRPSSSGEVLSIPRRKDNFMFLDMDVVAALNWKDGVDFAADVLAKEQEFGRTVIFSAFNPDQNSGTLLIEDPSETRRYIFAAGGLDEVIANPIPGPTVDRFHISAGMDGDIIGGIGAVSPGMFLDNGDRAFLRAETWADLGPPQLGFSLSTTNLVQSDFMVINPDAPVIGSGAETPKVLYADAATATVNGRQVSTISATIGEVRFRFGSELNGGYQDSDGNSFGNEEIVDAVLKLRTVASSRGYDASGEQEVPTLIWSVFESTAAGGGNPRLGDGSTPDPGRLGFFVLENAGIVFDDVEDRGTLPGGTESPLGGASDLTFAALRLGVATGSEATSPNRTGLLGNVRGFATAIFDTESGNATTLSTFGAPDLVERLDPSSGLAPNLAFTDYNPMANTFSIDLAGLSLGGTEGQSAFVDDFAFGARTTDDGPGARSNVALIAGDMVAAGVSPALPNQARDAAGQKYDHVKWGFFFGDTDTGVTSGTRTHAHLGSFAAGRLLTEDDAVQITSQANITTAVVGYRGHMVGNVLQGGSVRTATGSFSDTFSFASRTGSVTANFDGRSLMGDSAAPTNLQAYTGSISGGGLTGELNGRFVGPAETRLSTTGTNVLAPAGMVGAFSLSGGTASDYRAVGTFAAE